MVRVGLVRFSITIRRSLLPRGEVEYRLGLMPEANRYRVLAKEWHGVHSGLVEKDVEAPSFYVSRKELLYEATPLREAQFLRQLSQEVADNAVNVCLACELVDFSALSKTAACYIVRIAVMNAAIKGESDEVHRVDHIDLVADMRAIRELRERMAREAWIVHLRDREVHAAETRRRAEGARQKSFDLFFSIISPVERQEAEEAGQITVRNAMGEFVVPIADHALVRHYVDRRYVASYCIVFKDYWIPVGDEALMKYALLKTDPARFLKVANRFVERERGPVIGGRGALVRAEVAGRLAL